MKQKFLPIFISAGALLASSGASAAYHAGLNQFVEQQGVRYEILDFDAATVAVAGLTDEAEDYLFCPSEIKVSGEFYMNGAKQTIDDQTFTVVQINSSAFSGNSTFYYITFPETLTDIGDEAFKNCQLLTFDELPSNLETIGAYAFSGCPSIEKITLPESVTTLGEGVFSNMLGLTRLVMQNSAVEEIPAYALNGDKELSEVYLPLCVKKISDRAFFNTLSLEELYFPEGLQEIGAYAFCGQSYAYGGYAGGLSKISLPSSLEKMGERAFYVTPLYSADLSKTKLTEIPANAFYLCYNLSDIKLPETLETIGDSAFVSCGGNASVGMTDVVIPNSVTTIGAKAFNDTKTISFKIGDGVSTLLAQTFGTPSNMELGAGIKSIDTNAFELGDLRLIRLHAPTPPTLSSDFTLTEEQRQNITVVVDDGMALLYTKHPIWKQFNIVEDGKSRVSVVLDGTMGLGEAIYMASGIMPSRVTELTVEGPITSNDLEIIRQNMFSLTKLDISNTNLETIPDGTFSGMTLLTEMKLPKDLKAIGNNAFYNCRSLSITELPDGIETIGKYAFEKCSALKISKLPSALRTIGYAAFSECISLKSIVAGENLEDFGQASFSSCRMLEYVDLSASKITTLKANALYISESLRTLELPATLNKLDYRALAISGLRSLTLPAISQLEEEVFYETRFRAISFMEGLTTLPSGMFEGCNYLLTVSLPSTLKSVAANTFTNNSRLRMLSCAAPTAPSASAASFTGVQTQKTTLTIPMKGFSSYINAPGWGQFANFEFTLDVAVPEDVEITVVPEEDYADLVEDERMLEEQLENAEAAATDEDEPAEMRARRRAARRAASSALLDGSQFAKVFDGASIKSGGTGKGNRFFVRTVNGQSVARVLYNGEDITSQVEDGILVLPSDANGELRFEGELTSVNTIEEEAVNADSIVEIYTLTGLKVYNGRMADFLSTAGEGIYVAITSTGARSKICVGK